ncbi:hypothetical protein NM208_g15920 [Fusarium decemcellulare]|uniref:Uncharacterized protein n=1 Tax=Fusarium decemcellulare TaxID=57161 RepID=A0ACC1RDJ0_9HYPO|nr:hypothetical protein NM208_g15920 [Fusarium decemcellulare]
MSGSPSEQHASRLLLADSDKERACATRGLGAAKVAGRPSNPAKREASRWRRGLNPSGPNHFSSAAIDKLLYVRQAWSMAENLDQVPQDWVSNFGVAECWAEELQLLINYIGYTGSLTRPTQNILWEATCSRMQAHYDPVFGALCNYT